MLSAVIVKRRPHPSKASGGVTVDRLVKPLADPSEALEGLIDQLDQERGCVFQSSYEVPGRYARWTMGFVNPPLAFEGWGRRFTITALNKPKPNPHPHPNP